MLSPAATNLKLLRTKLFLSQEAFGRFFHLTRHMVNSYEMGRAKVPASLTEQLGKIFGFSIEAFTTVEWTPEAPPLDGVTLQTLEKENKPDTTLQVNEWREKYYTVLEKYNEALEELRHYKKPEDRS